jgi:SNF2 family DNA or RNA helicase
VLLTGTPVQNNLSELYSLLMFVEPSIFNAGSAREAFLEHFSALSEKDTESQTRKALQSEMHEV